MSNETSNIIEEANEVLAEQSESVMSLAEYIDYLSENPNAAATSAQYLLNAIEYFGTRKVTERGEEKTRYRFFDDPLNDGEHAVLGNTEMLNSFVDNLRQIAESNGRDYQLLWVEGPTATGKSEFKRCLINGLRAYSQTEEGRRFTFEWNIKTRSTGRGLSYNDKVDAEEDDWFESPVQGHPHSVLPDEPRRQLCEILSEKSGLSINSKPLDPFSKEAYETLKKHYEQENSNGDLFSRITSERHFRVRPYTVDIGNGIGVLHSEDAGKPKERLVGSWMYSMLQELDSRGRKNPQAFSYDGVLAQGNNHVSIVEDAAQHADLLQNLLNIPEEEETKIDKEISMALDTVIILISNPDLKLKFNEMDKKGRGSNGGIDPLRALKRRLEHHRFHYLTNYALETALLEREITGNTVSPEHDITKERISSRHDIYNSEAAPHTLEIAALYNVVSRLNEENLPNDLSLIDKAELFTWGEHRVDGERKSKDDYDFDSEAREGEHGIPVTYTRDILMDLLYKNDVVLPQDIIEEMSESFHDEPIFDQSGSSRYKELSRVVLEHALALQEEDVLNSILHEYGVSEETMREYIEQVYAWSTDESDIEVKPLTMKVFETKYLGQDEDDYDSNNQPSDEIKEFREDKIMQAINHYIWENRDDTGFQVEELPLQVIPEINDLIGDRSWEDVQREFDNFDPRQWESPPENTETAMVKETCINNMVENLGYSEESAKRTSQHVMNEVSQQWD